MKATKCATGIDEVIIQGMFFCPYGKDSRNCFFGWLHKKTTSEKVAWFKSLSVRDKQDLMYCHMKCPAKASSDYQKLKIYQTN